MWRRPNDPIDASWVKSRDGKLYISSNAIEFDEFSFDENNVREAVLNRFGKGKNETATLAISSDDVEFVINLSPLNTWEEILPFPVTSTTEDVFGFVEFFKKCIRAYLIYAIIAIAIIILSEWIV